MWWGLVALFGVAIVAGALAEVARRRALRKLSDRGCTGRRWRQCFPDAKADEIREFLQFFGDSFGFATGRYLSFRPDDSVLELYLALNPPDWSIGDNMEFEELADGLQKRYAVTLSDIWHDQITLGELFQRLHGT